nr:hypothetical protein GCM10020093_092200 [Planobispora longispora]
MAVTGLPLSVPTRDCPRRWLSPIEVSNAASSAASSRSEEPGVGQRGGQRVRCEVLVEVVHAVPDRGVQPVDGRLAVPLLGGGEHAQRRERLPVRPVQPLGDVLALVEDGQAHEPPGHRLAAACGDVPDPS